MLETCFATNIIAQIGLDARLKTSHPRIEWRAGIFVERSFLLLCLDGWRTLFYLFFL